MRLNRFWRFLLSLLAVLLLLELALQKLNFPRYNEFYGPVSAVVAGKKDSLEQKIRFFLEEASEKPDLIPVDLREETAYDEIMFSLYLREERIWCIEKKRVNAKNIDIVAEDAAFVLAWHYLSKGKPSKKSPSKERRKTRTIL